MANTDVSICSLGLMQVGGKPINSFDTPGDVAVFLKARYPVLRDHLISMYPWEAFKVRKELTRASGSPGGYEYHFIMPGDALSPIAALYPAVDAKRGTSAFEVRSNRICTDYPEAWAEYTARRPEAEWPAWFVNLVTAAVSAECAFLVSDQASLQELWHSKAYGTPSEGGFVGLVGQGMIVDAQGSGNNPGIADDTFIASRWGAVYPGGEL